MPIYQKDIRCEEVCIQVSASYRKSKVLNKMLFEFRLLLLDVRNGMHINVPCDGTIFHLVQEFCLKGNE